jgi:DNA repair ATPase RecN
MPTRLRSVSTTSGFLEHATVDFAAGLTCIIGARGTCKSTLIESIRFAFDCDSDRVKILEGEGDARGEPTFELVKHTLGPGCVQCEIITENSIDEIRYVLEREVGSAPRIFQDGVREHAHREILHGIEVFSQGDLQRIAEDGNDEMRLALMDRPNRTEILRLTAEREAAADVLRRVGPELRSLRAQISQLRQELQPFPGLKEQLRRVRETGPALPPDLELEHARFHRRSRILDAVKEIETWRADAVAQLRVVVQRAHQIAAAQDRVLNEALGENGAIGAGAIDVDPIVGPLKTVVAAAKDLLASAEALGDAKLESEIALLAEAFETQNEPFYRLRQEQQVLNESLKQQQLLQRQVEYLERREEELREALKLEQQLIEEREKAREGMARAEDEMFTLRIAEVEAINREHGDSVFLTLQTGTGSPRYVARLAVLLGGSRIRNQDEVAKAIAETFTPAAVIDIVESGSGQRFADVLHRDLGQMNRVVAYMGEQSDLYALEAEPAAAKLEITFYDRGVPKKVETLSKGQKATALLPLILRPLPYPLLIDQPEDDLDNSFIFHSLIKAVQKLKRQRQLIFVTHNANIPVLGGADQVVVMRMRSPRQADLPLVGSVDERKVEILDLLEGGAEAFQLREQHYHELLEDVVGTLERDSTEGLEIPRITMSTGTAE